VGVAERVGHCVIGEQDSSDEQQNGEFHTSIYFEVEEMPSAIRTHIQRSS
jgi:hypothetical protein